MTTIPHANRYAIARAKKRQKKQERLAAEANAKKVALERTLALTPQQQDKILFGMLDECKTEYDWAFAMRRLVQVHEEGWLRQNVVNSFMARSPSLDISDALRAALATAESAPITTTPAPVVEVEVSVMEIEAPVAEVEATKTPHGVFVTPAHSDDLPASRPVRPKRKVKARPQGEPRTTLKSLADLGNVLEASA